MFNKNRFSRRNFYACFILFSCLNFQVNAQTKKPLTRKESFFGLHFDFHAGKSDLNIGETLTEAMVDSLLRIVKPDFIQVDCKGHPGITSYPTKVGTPATSFAKDPLRIFRDVTSKYGVALYVHYSGVKDNEAIEKHPEWARIAEDGTRDKENISVHSAYNDQLLIPQLREAIMKYQLDGVWVDGDCWATAPDYSDASLKKYFEQTGRKPIPSSEKKIDTSFMQFSRRSFLEYVQHYAKALHETDPHFQVASNWAFSSFMPQPVNIDVDFISGDLTPNNSVTNAGFEARCIASQALKYNLPWDIMSWSFSMNWDRTSVQSIKSVTQLTQEAAEIIAVGGGFQCYFTQNRDASIRPYQLPVMKGLGEFMRKRQAFCRDAKPVPQVAVLYSSFDKYMRSKQLFTNGGLDAMRGITNMLMDAQQSVQVLSEHHLTGNLDQYPLIVIPETQYLDSSFRNELLQYANNGGHLVVIGTKSIALVEKEAGLKLNGPVNEGTTWLGFNASMTAMDGDYQPVSIASNVTTIGALYTVQDLRFPSTPAASIINYGKGTIATVFTDLGENYNKNQSSLQRDFLQAIVNESFKNPKLRVSGSHLVHVVLNTQNNKSIIHLINAGGQHANRNNYSYDELPPLSDISVSFLHAKPTSVMLEPEHKKIPFEYKSGKVIVKVPAVAVHSMIVIE